MNGDSRDMPGHRPVVDPSTTGTTLAPGRANLAPFTSADLLDSGQYEASKAAELRRQPQRSGFSRGFALPLEKADHPCGTPLLFRLDDGRLLARRVDCRTKACPRCGPRLRAQAARTWAAVIAAGVSRLVVADADWPRYQRKLR
jgi:hypothetical protein